MREGRRPEGASNRYVVEDHVPCMASHDSVVLCVKHLIRPSVLPRPLLKSRLLSLNSYTCLEIRFNQDTTSLCRHVTWGRRSMPTSEVVIFMVMPCMGSSTRVCNSAFNCVFDVSAHVCSFCSSYRATCQSDLPVVPDGNGR